MGNRVTVFILLDWGLWDISYKLIKNVNKINICFPCFPNIKMYNLSTFRLSQEQETTGIHKFV